MTIINEETKNEIKVVVFDIGQVLVDFNFEDFIKNKLKEEAKIEKVINASVKSNHWKELDRGVLTNEEIMQLFVKEDPSVEEEIRFVFSSFHGILKERVTTRPWIKELKEKGYQVYYLSNFPERMESECAYAIQFLEEMDGGILSYKEKIMKPDKEIFELLMKRYDFTPEESVFIDDNEPNVLAAQNLGIHGILFTNLEEVKQKLVDLGV